MTDTLELIRRERELREEYRAELVEAAKVRQEWLRRTYGWLLELPAEEAE